MWRVCCLHELPCGTAAVGVMSARTGYIYIYIYIYCVDRGHCSALHGDRCAACCKAHSSFAHEPVFLMTDNVRKEGK
jgi:hypothetical protein